MTGAREFCSATKRKEMEGDVVQKLIRVLLVDDQPRARRSLKALLSTWSQIGEMYEASDGREAVQFVKEHRPDVVLMDVRMPEVDGLTATVQIKALWPEIRVVVLSMYLEYRAEALAAGADAFVGKGEAPARLLDILSRALQNGV